jgi:hypothetical protein
MAYSAIYTAATDAASPLRKQVAVAIHKAAVDVMNESAATALHQQRYYWARRAVSSADAPLAMASRWIWSVLENATIQAAPATATDSDVQFVVNSLVNVMANAGE